MREYGFANDYCLVYCGTYIRISCGISIIEKGEVMFFDALYKMDNKMRGLVAIDTVLWITFLVVLLLKGVTYLGADTFTISWMEVFVPGAAAITTSTIGAWIFLRKSGTFDA